MFIFLISESILAAFCGVCMIQSVTMCFSVVVVDVQLEPALLL